MPFFLKLDGYVARNFKGQMSSFGTFLDPLADKVMMTVMFTTLSIANIVPGKLSYYNVYRNEENVYPVQWVVNNTSERSL